MNERGEVSVKPTRPAPDFLDLAGSIDVPAVKRGAAWDGVISVARRLLVCVRR